MHDKKHHAGRKILITGGTSGLGLELSKQFINEGCKVLILGRNKPDSFGESEKSIFVRIDFSDLRSVSDVTKQLAGEIDSLDIIINNAGVLSPPQYTSTSDGIEYTFQVNYLSHLVVNEILTRAGKVARQAKVVSVTSPVYRYVKPDFRIHGPDNYHGFRAYAESKFYTLLTGRYLDRVLPGNELVFFCFNPGTFSSGIARMQSNWFRNVYKIGAPFLRSPARPASDLIEILRNGEIINGAIYSSVNRMRLLKTSDDVIKLEKFIEESFKLTSRFVDRS